MGVYAITGASSGMGAEFVRTIESFGVRLDEIWAIARRQERLKALQAPCPVRPLALDLTDPASFSEYQALLEQGYSKVALGHHYDDAVETFLMSLLFEGRIGCFEPVTYLDRTGVTQIRPMLYLTEGMVRTFAAEHDLPVVHNPCPADKHTKRQEIKELVAVLSKTYPDLKARVFGAMQRLPLPQWGVTPHQRGSQKQLHQHDGGKAGQAEKADDAGRGRGDGDIEPGQGRE